MYLFQRHSNFKTVFVHIIKPKIKKICVHYNIETEIDVNDHTALTPQFQMNEQRQTDRSI